MELEGRVAEELRAVARASGGPSDGAGVTQELVFGEPVASATAGIWRFAAGEWSVVLKLLHHSRGGSPNWRSGEEEDHWYYWKREALAYRSGLLESLGGGLRAPRCFGVFDRPDGTAAIWLEDLRPATPAGEWSLERYRMAASHLGHAQAAISTSGELPAHRWLARDWLRAYVARREPFLGLLDTARARHHPLVRRHLPPELSEEVRAIWRDRERFFRLVEGLPPTLCHLDLHPANLFADARGTVTVDWAFVGIGHVGEDAANLIFDAVFDFFVRPESFDALCELVTDGYIQGLRAGGLEVDDSQVIRAMAAAAAVKFFWIPPAMVDAAVHDRELLNRRPIEEAFAWWAPVLPPLLRLARLAR